MQFISAFKSKFSALPARTELGRAKRVLSSEAAVEFELLASEICKSLAQRWKPSELLNAEGAKLLQPIAYACCSERTTSGAETAHLASLRLQIIGRREVAPTNCIEEGSVLFL